MDKECVSTAYRLIFAEKIREKNCKLISRSLNLLPLMTIPSLAISLPPVRRSCMFRFRIRQQSCFFSFFFKALITDIVGQISSADDLTNLANKIFQEQDSNLNEQITKDLKVMTTRWNSLCESVINNSNR